MRVSKKSKVDSITYPRDVFSSSLWVDATIGAVEILLFFYDESATIKALEQSSRSPALPVEDGLVFLLDASAVRWLGARAQVAMHAQDQPKKVDVAEIQAIERFYEKLCHLVERQRVSDPLSLSIVHKTKAYAPLL